MTATVLSPWAVGWNDLERGGLGQLRADASAAAGGHYGTEATGTQGANMNSSMDIGG
jgi:hypothetical protein